MKRSIQMKMFASTTDHAEMALAQSKMPAGQFTVSRTLGQIIGNIFDVKVKSGELPDGTTKESLLAVGEFEGVVYATGKVVSSTSAYLPAYYLEVVQSILAKDPTASVLCAVEIVLAPTGKSIPTAYEVRNLVRRRPDNPLNALKLEMAAAGRLRLPPPTERDPNQVIEGEVLAIAELAEAGALEGELPADGEAEGEGSAAEDAGASAQGDGEAAATPAGRKGRQEAPAA